MVWVAISEKCYLCSSPCFNKYRSIFFAKGNSIHRKTDTEYFNGCTICLEKTENQGKIPASNKSERDLNLDFTDTT